MKKTDDRPKNGKERRTPQSRDALAVSGNFMAEEMTTLNQYARRLERVAPVFSDIKGREATAAMKSGEEQLFSARMTEALGTTSEPAKAKLLAQVFDVFEKSSETKDIDNLNAAIALLHGIQPTGELEGMLAIQMIGTHNAAIVFLRRAILQDQTFEGTSENVNRATKLLRTFVAQMEAFTKFRTQGLQKVVVEHVHVDAGGQAVVGVVNHGGGGSDK